MPFLQEGTTAESNYVDRQPAQLLVAPDKVLALKRRFEDRRDKVQDFILARREDLANLRPPAPDPYCAEPVRALSDNGDAAMGAAWGFVQQLTGVIDALDEMARTYGLVEDTNAQRFRQGHR